MGIDFVQGYGLTETSPIVTLNPIDHYKETSVGKVIPQVEMRIVEPDEKGIGEVAIRGPVVMQGYYNNEAATREVLTPDGFLLTGDMGYLDGENYLYLTGRKKLVIVTEGGKNVYPEEIENCFQLYDEVEQVLVRGYVEDPAMHSERIEAVFYPAPDWLESSPLKGDPEGIAPADRGDRRGGQPWPAPLPEDRPDPDPRRADGDDHLEEDQAVHGPPGLKKEPPRR